MNKKRKIITLISTLTISAAMIVVVTATSNQGHSFVKSADSSYSLTLNGANAYTGSTSKTTKALSTDSGNYKVNFEYSGCSVSTNNHASISSSGYIRNSDHILSIVEFVANYTGGDLQIRTSYDGLSWGNYFDIKSGVPVSLSSKPYFIEMKPTSGNTTLTSAQYKYSCSENPDIPTGGYKRISSVDELQDGKKVIIFGNKNTTSGIGLNETTYNKYYLTGKEGTVTNNFLDNVVSKDYTIYTVTKSDSKYVFKSSTNKYLSSEVEDGKYYNVKTSTTLNDGAKWSITSTTNGFNVESGLNVYLEAKLYNGITPEFCGNSNPPSGYPINFYVENSGLPVDLVSISLADTGIYHENSVYDGSNLIVTGNYTDGLSKKITSGYTYSIKDSSGNVIEPGSKFGAVGEFTLTVTYKEFTKSLILDVGRDVQLRSAEISMSVTEFTTKDTIASALTNLTGDLHYNYSDEDEYGLDYDTLSNTYGFEAKLTLNGSTQSITGKFLEAGSYKLSITNGVITSNEVILTVAKAVTQTWTKVADASTLKAGDVIVIGESSKGYTAGDISKQVMTPVETKFTSDTIEDLPEDAVELTLGGSSGSWTLENDDGKLLYATAVKKLAWNSTSGNNKWSISISNGKATILNGTTSYGRFLYNNGSGQERFTTYATSTSESATMILPQIYRGKTGEDIYATDITLSKYSTALTVGETETLSVTYTPSNTTIKTIEWSTENSSVVTVSDGILTATGVGSTTVTASYTKKDGNKINKTCNVTVSGIKVTGVSLDKTTLSLKEGASQPLTPTVLPTNATNKNVSWSTSDSSVATVTNGTVTAVKEGSATITVTTQDGGKTATCAVTVTKSGSSGELVINYDDAPANYGTDTKCEVDGYSIIFKNVGNSYTANYMQCKKSDSYIYNETAISGMMSITINTGEKSWSGTVYYGSIADPTKDVATGSSGKYTIPSGNSYFKLVTGSSTGYIKSITIEYSTEPVNPTGISLPSEASVTVGQEETINVIYSPSNCNQNKGITWTSSDTSVATVSANGDGVGVIKGIKAGTSIITAKSTYNTSFTDTCTVTVSESANDKWTIMVYMCGADLESDSGQASGDIKEMLGASGKPDDVNVIIETGGSSSWSLGSSYLQGATSIPSSQLGRWHIENSKLVKDSFITNASMAYSSTYQSFLSWGLTNYPADKVGVVLWNHGGGLDGVCFDENFDDGYYGLYNSDMKKAHANTIGNNKLEFIGYDACLMQCADIADFNSSYFKYQVASQESENGSGWNYKTWLPSVYSNDTTLNICKKICDTFISTQGKSSNQTLSTLDLSYASSFKTAWNNYASALSAKFKSGSVSKNTFANWAKNNIKNYSDPGYCGYGQFDIVDWLNKCANQTSYAVDTSYKTAVTNVLSNYVAYNTIGSGAGNSNGLCCVYCCTNQVSYESEEYAFSNWATFNNSYGL